MKRILSILRHVHAVVENRIRVRALTSIKPNDAHAVFCLLKKFGWNYFLLDPNTYLLICDKPLPQKCLDIFEKATHKTWLFTSQNISQESLLKSSLLTENRLESILVQAFRLKASDVFLMLNKSFANLKFRIKRHLTEPEVLSLEEGKSIVKKLFALANLSQDNALYHREGHFRYEIGGKTVFFRLSFIASETSQSLVLRLLSEEVFPFDLKALNLPCALMTYLNEMVKSSRTGMILMSGSTGSGKTTTAYALAKFFAENGHKVISLEDPIEAEITSIIQSEISDPRGYRFKDAMAAILRQDPDVIVVGEIRDFETARAAFYASLSGYWVITTLHSESLQNVPFRCQELGISFSEFADNVRLQIHQQWGQDEHPKFTWEKK